MRLFDCFTFFNELDLLEIRLEELDSVVDQFVLAESPYTFTGKPKPLIFGENKQRFARYLHKITHIVVDDLPMGDSITAWNREHFQRSALKRGLADAAPEDLVLLSDVDEIPKRAILQKVKNDPATAQQMTILEAEIFLYYLNTRPKTRVFFDKAPRILAKRYLRDPQVLRGYRTRFSRNPGLAFLQPIAARFRALFAFGAPLKTVLVPEAVWHFTYMGGAEKVRDKVLSYAHTEMQTEANTSADALSQRIARREAIVDWGPLEDIALDDTFPAALQRDPDRWSHMLAPR